MSKLRDRLEDYHKIVELQKLGPCLEVYCFLRALLTAIVDRLEPLEIPADACTCEEPEEAPSTEQGHDVCVVIIRKLRKERNDARKECGEVKDALDQVANGRNHWKQRCEEAEAAKVKVEQRIMGLEAVVRGYESQHGACGDCAADAELGRLVRGMQVGKRLTRGLGGYGTKETHPCAWFPDLHDDPAEALRAIQAIQKEVDDAAT